MSMRFGSATMIAGAMASAIAFYTLSLHVSAERAEADKLRARIAADLRDIRALEAELRTRARLPVLQQWNDDVLALAAPTSKQFADSAIQLASFAPGASQPMGVQQPSVQLALATETAVPQLPIIRASYQTSAAPRELVVALPAVQPAQPERKAAAEAKKAEPRKVEKAEPKKVEAKPEAPVRLAEAKPKSAPKVPTKPALDGFDSLAGVIDNAAAAERGVAFRKVSMQ